jgi:hypothetical protein
MVIPKLVSQDLLIVARQSAALAANEAVLALREADKRAAAQAATQANHATNW